MSTTPPDESVIVTMSLTERQAMLTALAQAVRAMNAWMPDRDQEIADLGRLLLLLREGFPQTMSQSQASTADQLKKLIPMADSNGFYDAADLLRKLTEGR